MSDYPNAIFCKKWHFVLSRFFKKIACFNVSAISNTQWRYISMQEHLYQTNMPTTSHNVDYIYIYCLHHITHYESIDFWLCLLMLKINILFNLFIKDCMFFTSTTKNFSGCLELIVMGHIHGFEEPWLFVLDGRPHHSPSLALNPNLHPNGFFYPIPNPPNKPCYTVHK